VRRLRPTRRCRPSRGRPSRGKSLTAHNGTWSNGPTAYSYRWQRCAVDGIGCGNIDNAASKTYVLKDADVDRTVRVMVTASNKDGQASASSAVTDIVAATTLPKNTVKPAIVGNAQIGEELTANPGTWTGGPRTFAYHWQRCDAIGENCTDATGSTGATYGVRAGDIGHTLRVVVTATNLVGPATVNSNQTAVVNDVPTQTPPATNHRPTVRILGVRFVGTRPTPGFVSATTRAGT
jgi:hypothetical protein